MREAEARRSALLQSELFRAMDAGALDAVAARATTRRVGRGETVLRRGDAGTSLLVVLQGKLRVGGASEEGRETALGVLGPGQIIGEMALLDGQARSADVTALEESVLLTVERAVFLDVLRRDSDFALRVMAMLCGRLRRANAALEDIATLDLASRLRRALARLAQEFGVAGAAGIRLPIRLSQRDLAALVGASREQVNREMKALLQAGEIARADAYLVLSPGFAAGVPEAR